MTIIPVPWKKDELNSLLGAASAETPFGPSNIISLR